MEMNDDTSNSEGQIRREVQRSYEETYSNYLDPYRETEHPENDDASSIVLSSFSYDA